MEKENLKKILSDACIERNRQLSRWRYHIAKHPEQYNEYVELQQKLKNEIEDLKAKLKEHTKIITKDKKSEYFKKYYEENKEIIKEKARIYSRDKYYPLHKEEKIKSVKAYQAKKKDQEYIFFPNLN
jgi:hypothetical protein